jgi:photosystem II stability/assembly factor-like uncharacterized protein
MKCVAVGDAGVVFTSTTSGQTWVAGASGTTYNFDALSCPTATACLATANSGPSSGTFASSTGGSTWTQVLGSEPSGAVGGQDQLVCTSSLNCMEASTNGAIFATTTGGTSWTFASSNYGATLWCSTATNCLAVSRYGIGTSTDGGATWTISYPFYAGGPSQDMACTSARCTVVFQGSYGPASTFTNPVGTTTWTGPVGL